MDEIVRVSFSVEWSILKEFDKYISKKGYNSRSMALRQLIENFVLSEKEGESRASTSSKSSFIIILTSETPLMIKKYFHITIPTQNEGFLTLIILENSTYPEAESKLISLKKENRVSFCKLIQIEKCQENQE